jgi:hypothetical protein
VISVFVQCVVEVGVTMTRWQMENDEREGEMAAAERGTEGLMAYLARTGA